MALYYGLSLKHSDMARVGSHLQHSKTDAVIISGIQSFSRSRGHCWWWSVTGFPHQPCPQCVLYLCLPTAARLTFTCSGNCTQSGLCVHTQQTWLLQRPVFLLFHQSAHAAAVCSELLQACDVLGLYGCASVSATMHSSA